MHLSPDCRFPVRTRTQIGPLTAGPFEIILPRSRWMTLACVSHFGGDLDAIVGKLNAHVEAGADHVGIQVIGIEPGQSAMPHWRALGTALLPQHDEN